MPTPNTNTTTPERELAQKALDLRISGNSWATVANQLGYKDESGARHAATRLLDRTDHELADEFRSIEGARLQKLLSAYWQKALDGDLDSAVYCLRVIDRRAKLFGLDMPVRVAVQGVVSDEEYVRQARGLMEQIMAGQPVVDAEVVEADK